MDEINKLVHKMIYFNEQFRINNNYVAFMIRKPVQDGEDVRIIFFYIDDIGRMNTTTDVFGVEAFTDHYLKHAIVKEKPVVKHNFRWNYGNTR